MANYIPTGEKRPLDSEEMRRKMLARGINYIPTGGRMPDEIPKPTPIVNAVAAIQKPDIKPMVKPGDKLKV